MAKVHTSWWNLVSQGYTYFRKMVWMAIIHPLLVSDPESREVFNCHPYHFFLNLHTCVQRAHQTNKKKGHLNTRSTWPFSMYVCLHVWLGYPVICHFSARLSIFFTITVFHFPCTYRQQAEYCISLFTIDWCCHALNDLMHVKKYLSKSTNIFYSYLFVAEVQMLI